jgi:long-subunit fatty acid transport protein
MAREIHEKAGTKAFPFLKINIGARAVGMGSAFTGLADDASALYYNPAGMTSLPGNRFITGYHNYVAGIQSGFVGGVWTLNDKSALGAYASYLNYGEFIEADQQGNQSGETFSGGDVLLSVAYARRLSYNIEIGATAKAIFETLEDYSSNGMAVDLAAKYSSDRRRLSVGVIVQNIGKQIEALDSLEYDLPLTVRGGISYKPVGLALILASDLIVPVDSRVEVALGVEYYEMKPFYLRLGWNSFGTNFRTADSDDNWAGLSVGVGFDVSQYNIGYAFQAGAELGDMHRITFTGSL